MNFPLFVSAIFHIVNTNNLKHCTQLFVYDHSSTSSRTRFLRNELSPLIHNDAVNYIFLSSDTFEKNVTEAKKPTPKYQLPCIISFAFSNSQISLNKSLDQLDRLNNYITQKEYDFFTFFWFGKLENNLERITLQYFIDYKYKLFVSINPLNKSVNYATACQYCSNGYPSLLKLHNPLFSDFLHNFNSKSLRISTPTSTTSLFEIRQNFQNIWLPVRGYQKFALEHLMLRYNFTSVYFPSMGGGGTGSRLPNNTWVGTVGDILSGRADIGVSSAQIYVRNPFVDFTSPMGYTWLTFTTGKGLPQYSWKSIYWPLSSGCWILVIISTIFTLVAFYLFRFIRKQVVMPRTLDFLFRSLLEQDAKMSCQADSVRLLVSFWLIFGFLITTAYRCKLVSMLAYPVLEEPPKTFAQLADALQYKISLQYVRGAAYVLLKTSPNPTLKKIFNRMYLEEDSVKCFKDLLGSDGKHKSCISWVDISIQVQHRNLSDKMFGSKSPLLMAQETCNFVGLPLMLKKGAVFRERFDRVIRRVVDMGIVEKWKMDDRRILKNERLIWLKTLQEDYDNRADTKDNLKVENLMGTFYLVVFGLMISVFAFLYEVLKYFVIFTWVRFGKQFAPTLFLVR